MKEANQIGLADFLADLRAELSESQSQSASDSLKLRVEEITLTLEVAFTLAKAADASAGVRAKFWVLASEVGVKGQVSSRRDRTQQLTLTLKPRVEQVVFDEQGRLSMLTRGVDVKERLAVGEEQPTVPYPAES